jgi:hypothetical protein
MTFWLFMKILMFVAAIFAVPSAIFAILWHLFYLVKGKPKIRFKSYLEHLFDRGALSATTFIGAIGVLGILFLIGWHITTRLPGTEVKISVDSTWSGQYSKSARDSLPMKSRQGLGEADIIFVQDTPDRYGRRRVLLVRDRHLRRELVGSSKMAVVEAKWINHLPPRLFAWFGPRMELECSLAVQGQLKVIGDKVLLWSFIKS